MVIQSRLQITSLAGDQALDTGEPGTGGISYSRLTRYFSYDFVKPGAIANIVY